MRVDLVLSQWDLFAWGLVVSLQLTALACLIGFALAVPLGLGVARGWRGAWAMRGFVTVFRGSPFLIQLYLIYYGLGQFGVVRQTPLWWILSDPFATAVLALSLNAAAYAGHVLRRTVEAMPKGEVEAAQALGLSPWQTDRLVVLPAALRRALPQMGNEVVFTLHTTSLASVVTVTEIMGAAQTFRGRTYTAYEPFLTAALLYLVLTLLLVALFRQIERRYLRHLSR